MEGHLSLIQNVDIAFQDSPAIDAFGRLRVSNPTTIFDSKQIWDDPDIDADAENQPLFYDNQEISGGGTATAFDVNRAETSLSVSADTAGVRVRQTRQRFNYQPGKSLRVEMSFLLGAQAEGITRREGLFDEKNGIFLEDTGTGYSVVRRSYATGSAVDVSVAQANWNLDKFDGTGPSGVTLDFEKAQLLIIDVQWLAVGRVRIGFSVAGMYVYAHEFLNANVLDVVYMSTPNLPLRSEIQNDGTGPASTLKQICATVISEGGANPTGIVRSASTNGTHVDCNTENTVYALLGIRLKSAYIGCVIRIIEDSILIATASHQCEWMLMFNPTVAGTFTYADETRSAVQIARGALENTVTDGVRICGGHVVSLGNASGGSGVAFSEIETALHIGSTIAGVSDEIVLCLRPISGSTNVDAEASITWRELL